MKKLFNFCLATFAFVTVFSCDDDENSMPEMSVTGPDMMVYGLTENNQLVAFNANNSSSFASTKAIMGIPSGEKLMSIDFRPATGELYAVSNASKFYIINTSTANTRAVNTTAFAPVISGTIASIDFNPTVDRIRLVTNTGQNLRLNPETGGFVATDGSIATTSSIAGVAYTNSKSGASTTILYDLDATSGKLFKQDPPNNGTLVEVGSLGITFTGQAAFDINPDNTVALMAATTGSQNNLYTVNLTSGKATNVGTLSQKVIDLAIPTNPVAYAIDNANALQIFDPNNPIPVTKPITGLQSGEGVLGIDFRPLNGQLYALGSSSRIYTINLGNGAATQVGTGTLSTLLTGTEFGFDFNPTVDKIRVVSNTGQNLRLDPVTGGVTMVDMPLNPTPVSVGAAAYSDNFAGTTTTSLFVIDNSTDKLYLQNPPNNGTLVERGALGINIDGANGFDIGSTSQKAYLVAAVGGTTRIYTVNTTNGSTASLAIYPNPVRGFAIGLGF
ncbi:DUF4394 domain-containing protein [Chryseobacterium wangxinyae]|uniref:DUF4394 domain-containing protein n=1 Tax=Chryseobacterium sp. CY350 TaxID=2997336 RepID=UPI00227039E0|nr:DUF4394 domain-containing protein [Chryseobacterium sp. CY350]MCY0978837.1 DUF4394 domain-containing protein [Chryseobacterium sp. CY350]WBZ93785.1 DUF4394 domain-containing protein [Chryseobacterium sp. CY350]